MDLTKLQALLDDQYTWPSKYKFKFVGNEGHREDLAKAVGHKATNERPSKSGKYISFTFDIRLNSSQEVISIYQEVAKISGIIAL